MKAHLLLATITLGFSTVFLRAAEPMPLVNFTAEGAEQRFVPSSKQVTVTRSADAATPGLILTVQGGNEGYPGVALKPESGAAWDLSAYGHVEMRVVNTGTKGGSVNLRLDNAGDWKDNPTNSEFIYLKPGEKGTLKVLFGYSYGKPGFALNPAAVSRLLIFTGKTNAEVSFRIESLEAAGPAGEKPPVNPASIRIKPVNGAMLGGGVAVDLAKQVQAYMGAKAETAAPEIPNGVRLTFPAGKDSSSVVVKPPEGRWDLREALEVRVKVRNTGKAPVTPRFRVESNGGASDAVTLPAPIQPGESYEAAVSFINAKIWDGSKDSGNKVTSDTITQVAISATGDPQERQLTIESITAGLPPQPTLPEWLGKKPPVEGDWVQTFNDDFNGTALDLAKWNNTGPNYWDKSSRWSPNNVIVGDGVVKMRYEKKTGLHNDDPKGKEAHYTSGYLDTYGKWVQRYGYFETRLKVPTAPGLWPAFWLMPDRGAKAGEQWKRQYTGNGAMEFDIFEQLTRWGPYRTNIALHWDGYEKDHKSTGSDKIYYQPDKDGFITTGVLWTPGLAAFYIQGKEVLRWENPRVSNVESDMMFTLPMGGWDNNRLDDTQLPADLVIDYVRVWQRKDLASPVDGPVAPVEKK